MLNLRVSSKKQAKIKLALQGCAGSGKTYSALLLAYGLCNDWTKIAIIDSENGSADLYAHLGAYNVLSLSDNFTPETYMKVQAWKLSSLTASHSVGIPCLSTMQDYKVTASLIGRR